MGSMGLPLAPLTRHGEACKRNAVPPLFFANSLRRKFPGNARPRKCSFLFSTEVAIYAFYTPLFFSHFSSLELCTWFACNFPADQSTRRLSR